MSVEPSADDRRGLLRRFFAGFTYFVIAALVGVGLLAILLELHGWYSGSRWRPEDINTVLAYDSPAMRTARAAWEDFKYVLQYGAYFIAAVALLIAVTHIKTLARLMKDFLDARGAIYQLAATMSRAEEIARDLAAQAERISKMEPTIKSMSEKLEEAMLKIGDLQRQSVSERSETVALPAAEMQSGPAPAAPGAAEDEHNWERLRELWNANGARIDEAIERIPEKRKRTRYSRMDRRNYPAIINGLADERIITQMARKGSLDLHATFMSYKPRNRKIPDRVIDELLVKDRMLDEEFSKMSEASPDQRSHALVENGAGASA